MAVVGEVVYGVVVDFAVVVGVDFVVGFVEVHSAFFVVFVVVVVVAVVSVHKLLELR